MSANVPPIFKALTREEQDILIDMVENDLYFPVLKKALGLILQDQVEELCRVKASEGRDKLIIEKAKLEGAQKVLKILDML